MYSAECDSFDGNVDKQLRECEEEKLDHKSKSSISQILQTPRLSLHHILPTEPKWEMFQVLQQLFVRIGVPLSFKNITECRGKGARALESLPRSYKLHFKALLEHFDKAAEGDKRRIEVVVNARNLGSVEDTL